jgi:lipopolysaccharide export system protein LptC
MVERRLAARDLVALVETPDGARNRILADFGEIDRGTEALRLNGNVTLTTTAGYVVSSDALFARLDRTYLESPGRVSTLMPGARLDAGGMRLSLVADAASGEGSYVLVFTGGVQMVYTPEFEE